MQSSDIHVLHCPTTVGGHAQQLARAERALGLQSVSVTFRQNIFQFPADEVLLREGEMPLKLEYRRWKLLWRALRQFDVIHFNFGQTILRNLSPYVPASVPAGLRAVYRLYGSTMHLQDLPLLKRTGKAIVVTYQGDDARQGDYCREHFAVTHAAEVAEGYYTPKSDAQKRADIARIARYADEIYSLNPDLFHVLPAKTRFMPYANVDLHNWQPVVQTPSPREQITLLHAPTERRVKGTKYILEAVDRLREQDHIDLELILVENMAHAEALRAYQRADLLIDQLLVGWYGGLSVELMALGKPVICYLREEDLEFIPPEMRAEIPIINATPGTIYHVLKEWITTRRHELPERGRQGRAYVERWHDPLKIAQGLKATYETILTSKRHSAAPP